MLAADDRKRKALVYWIKHPSHTDMLSQGYIGFSSSGNSSKRWNEHVCDAERSSKYPVHRAIRKYGKDVLEFKILCIGSAEYCLDIERKLRPERMIGWNICPGGGAPGLGRKMAESHKLTLANMMRNRVISDETRRKIGMASMGRSPSIEAREKMRAAAKARGFADEHKRNISLAKKGVPSTNPAWLHPAADKKKWTLAGQYYDLYNYGFGRIPSGEMLGYNGDAFKPILMRIKAGWNPWKDETFQAWKASVQEIL